MESSLVYASIGIPVVGSFFLALFGRGGRKVLALLISIVTLILIVSMIKPTWKEGSFLFPKEIVMGFNLNFLVDGVSLIFALTFALVGALTVFYSLSYMERYPHQREYYLDVVLMIGSLIGLSFSANLILMYLFWELASICTWRLVGFHREPEQVLIADKAFLMTFFGASFMLLGFVVIYQEAGTLELIALKGKQVNDLALFFILLGILSKSATLPLQTWLPDAHPVAPSPMSALLSGIVAKIGLFAFVRIFCQTFAFSNDWILILAVLSSLVAAGAALLETDMKRIIAYSTVSQIGYMFLGLGLLTSLGIMAALLYFVVHAIAKAGLFLCAGIVEHNCKERDINKLGGLIKAMPITGVSFLFCSFSIIGIPPFGGFYSKLMVVMATVKSGHYILALLAVFTAVLTLLYLLRTFNAIFLGEAKFSQQEGTKGMVITVAILGGLSLLIGIFIRVPLDVIQMATNQILGILK